MIERFGAFILANLVTCLTAALTVTLLIMALTSSKHVVLSARNWECVTTASVGIEAVCTSYSVKRSVK